MTVASLFTDMAGNIAFLSLSGKYVYFNDSQMFQKVNKKFRNLNNKRIYSVTSLYVQRYGVLVQFIRSVVSDSLRPHELQHARPPCPSPTPGVHPYPCPLSRWCHPIISSSVVPFSSCPQSFLASGSCQMSQFFASGGQSTRVSVLASVLPVNI